MECVNKNRTISINKPYYNAGKERDQSVNFGLELIEVNKRLSQLKLLPNWVQLTAKEVSSQWILKIEFLNGC